MKCFFDFQPNSWVKVFRNFFPPGVLAFVTGSARRPIGPWPAKSFLVVKINGWCLIHPSDSVTEIKAIVYKRWADRKVWIMLGA